MHLLRDCEEPVKRDIVFYTWQAIYMLKCNNNNNKGQVEEGVYKTIKVDFKHRAECKK
jgi:hypothetical protein